MPPHHHKPKERLRDKAWKNRGVLTKAALLTTLTGLFLTWLTPKLLDASWERLCKWKEEADKVPALEIQVSNLTVSASEDLSELWESNQTMNSELTHQRWQLYSQSNRIANLERKIK